VKGSLSGKVLVATLAVIVLPLTVLNLYASGDGVRIATLATVVLALGVAFLFFHSLQARIARLNRYAEGMLDAAPPHTAPVEADDELGDLARTLARMAPKIGDLVHRLSVEFTRRETILKSMAEGVLAVDQSLKVTFCNSAFAAAIGGQAPIPEGVPLVKLMRDPELLGMLKGTVESGRAVKGRIQLLADGRSFQIQTAPLSMQGAIAILYDITELDRLERIRKDFVANVSHELRTPLAAIRGYAETLLDGGLEDADHRRKFVEVILANSIRLNNIASDLLALSEMEAGKQVAPPSPVSVRAAMQSALSSIESEAKLRHVSLIAEPMEEAEILGYKIRLEQAFLNLLSNAVKFNRPNGEVRVEVSRQEDGKARIVISDTGLGIPSEDLPRIFERFYRVDKARSREVGGTGLGLSIVKHAVEQMNGTISVESQIGKGSRFIVVLPVTGPHA
jgi:two-component system phosphate regulon sensor histidine kinase PhoR